MGEIGENSRRVLELREQELKVEPMKVSYLHYCVISGNSHSLERRRKCKTVILVPQ